MARKKSGRLAAQKFRERAEEIAEFALDVAESGVSDQYITWAYDFAIIRLYREFEDLMLEALIVAINNDTATISQRTGLVFPKHLTDEVCEFLILGTGYFDFKGRDGLLRKLQEFLPADHYLVVAVKRAMYKPAIEKLVALRNCRSRKRRVQESGHESRRCAETRVVWGVAKAPEAPARHHPAAVPARFQKASPGYRASPSTR